MFAPKNVVQFMFLQIDQRSIHPLPLCHPQQSQPHAFPHRPQIHRKLRHQLPPLAPPVQLVLLLKRPYT